MSQTKNSILLQQQSNKSTLITRDLQAVFKNHFQDILLPQMESTKYQFNDATDCHIQLSSQQKQFVESVRRTFQIKLSKEKQLQNILLLNLQQEVEFLKGENITLKNQNKTITEKLQQKRLDDEIASTKGCSSSLITINQISNLKNMLMNLQSEHQNCISSKKELLDVKQTLEIKIKILENENKQIMNELKEYKKKSQSYGEVLAQNEQYLKEIKFLKGQIQNLRASNQQKEKQFNEQLSLLQKSIQNIKLQNQASQNIQQKPNFENSCLQVQETLPQKGQFLSKRDFVSSNNSRIINKNLLFSEINKYPLCNISQNSLNNKQSYSTKEKLSIEKKIIEDLYKKNLELFKDKNIQEKPQNRRLQKMSKIQAILNATENKFPSEKDQSIQKSYMSTLTCSYNMPDKSHLSTRRFRYL